MNIKYFAPIVLGLLLVLGVIGGIVIDLFKPDSLNNYLTMVITILGLAATAGFTLQAVSQVNNKVDTVQHNTNGNLTKLIAQNQALLAQVTPQQVTAANATLAAPTTVTTPVIPHVTPEYVVPANIVIGTDPVTPVTPLPQPTVPPVQ